VGQNGRPSQRYQWSEKQLCCLQLSNPQDFRFIKEKDQAYFRFEKSTERIGEEKNFQDKRCVRLQQ